MSSPVRLRFPPSPTGVLHIGTVRTCLSNFLFAKKNGGKIILRMEDSDTKRSQIEYSENIMSGLQHLGITWDEGPFFQSQRTGIYKRYIQKLLEKGKAYFCFCTEKNLQQEREEQIKKKLPPRYSGKCRNILLNEAKKRIELGEKAVIRFRVNDHQKNITFSDLIRGETSIHSKEIADFVIAKDLDSPLYNFAVVIDDHDMNISHIIRGEDHISNTPKQILIYEALDWEIPKFAHLPLILNPDKSKLSKRKNTVSVDDYLEDGILPEALINFIALLGWNTSDEQEIFSFQELQEKFSLERIQKSGAIFDTERLLWMNGIWIRKKSPKQLEECVWPFLKSDSFFIQGRKTFGKEFLRSALVSIQQRLRKLSEAPKLLRFFFLSEENYYPEKDFFPNKKMKVNVDIAKNTLEESQKILEEIPEKEWNEENLKTTLLNAVKTMGVKNGQLLWPIRTALSGELSSPGAFELLAIFGKKRSLIRIEKGIRSLS
jgi:glutamyl-tRNA synthetase